MVAACRFAAGVKVAVTPEKATEPATGTPPAVRVKVVAGVTMLAGSRASLNAADTVAVTGTQRYVAKSKSKSEDTDSERVPTTVGAVGVSGDTSDNDEICAIAGIEAAGLKANPG